MAYSSLISARKVFQLTALSMAVVLSGCGGGGGGGTVDSIKPTPCFGTNCDGSSGGGDDDTPSTDVPVEALQISNIVLYDLNGAETNTITKSGATAKVKVMDSDGNVVPNALATFSGTSITFGSTNGNVITDENGEADIFILPSVDNDTGSYVMTVAVSHNGDTATSSDYYYSLQTVDKIPGNVGSIEVLEISNIALYDTQGNQTRTITDNGAIVKTTVKDGDGNVIPNALVSFTGTNIEFGSSNGTVITDENGVATLAVLPTQANDTGSYTMSAAVTYDGKTATSSEFYYSLQTDDGSTPVDILEIGNIALYDANGNATRTVTSNGATAKAKIVDGNGNPITNALVTFKGENVDFGSTNGTVITNQNGEAVVTVIPTGDNDTGSYTMSATVTYDGKTVTTKDFYYNLQVNSGPPAALVEAYDVYVSISRPELLTGSDKVIMNVRVTDKAGGVKANVPVNLAIVDPKKYGFSFDGNSNQVTNEQGLITIRLVQNNIGINSQLDHESEVVVTVDDGVNASTSQTIPISATGAEVIDVTVTSSVIAANDKVTLTGALVDGAGDPIANAPLELLNNGKDVFPSTSIMTDTNGHFNFVNINGNQLTANNGDYVLDLVVNPGYKVTQTFDAIATLNASTSQNISLEYDDIIVSQNGTIVVTVPNGAGKDIKLSTTKGLFNNGSSVETKTLDANGKATFVIQSSVPGIANIETEFDGQTQSQNLNFVSINPQKLLVQANAALLAINTSTKLSARVLDNNDAPVANAIVEFTVVKDGSGGQLSKGIVQTDVSGVATVTYTAGNNPTAANGVEIITKVSGVKLPDGTINNVSIGTVTTNLTVQTTASTIGFGLADKIGVDASDVYYFRKGSVFVNNNNGQPAANQTVTLAVRPKFYLKGYWDVVKDPAGDKLWVMFSKTNQGPDVSIAAQCDNEDINFNSILDPGEDENNNGQLEPGFIATLLVDNQVVVSNGAGVYELTTNNKGRVDFTIRYSKQYASWMDMTMSAATTVDGTEATQQRLISFPVLQDDVDIGKRLRPDLTSPFGIYNDCTNPY